LAPVTLDLPTITEAIDDARLIDLMRDALVAQSAGMCQTPMPMHLDVEPESAEVHMKSSYRRGGRFLALKLASTFPGNLARGLSTGNGIMLLISAETGAPVAILADEGHLTDVRTAAVTAMVTRELGRRDRVLGIVGSGIQARLQVRFHAAVLPLEEVIVWGRDPGRAESCVRDIAKATGVAARTVRSPAEVAGAARLVVTCTASRAPLLERADLLRGTHVNAVGADGPGKRELSPEVVRSAAPVLVDSLAQCLRLGETQHAPDVAERAIEIGTWCTMSPSERPPAGELSLADFTGLGVEDLYIAEHVYLRVVEGDARER
jgi:ornithine cyclodeaminase